MKLYAFPPSPNTWKVRAVAAHLGVPLEMEFVDLFKGASRQPAFLAINPTGRTPTLVDGDFKLGEATAIMQYIASQKPNALWPDNARTRADIMRWQSWSIAHWGKEACEPLLFQRLVKQLVNMGPPDEAVVAKGVECFNKEAAVLEAHLKSTPIWCARTSRSPISRWRHRCSTPTARAFRWPLIRTSGNGLAASPRCRAGATLLRSRPPRQRNPVQHGNEKGRLRPPFFMASGDFRNVDAKLKFAR